MWGSVEEKGTWVEDLLGQHRYQLDAKGRIALPAKYRGAFRDGVYLTLGLDGCLFAYPREAWQAASAKVQALRQSDREARSYARMFFGSAHRVEMDGQGRVVVPLGLRARVGLDREAVVVGVGDRLEIWPGPAWDREQEQMAAAYLSGSLRPVG
jgi:MraZ protein